MICKSKQVTEELLSVVLIASPAQAEKADHSEQLPLHLLCANSSASVNLELITWLYLKNPQAAKKTSLKKMEPPQMWLPYANQTFDGIPNHNEFLVVCLQTAARQRAHDTFRTLIQHGVDPDVNSKADPQSARNIGQVTENDTNMLDYYEKVNRLLGKFKLEKKPKHTSETCCAIAALDVRGNGNQHVMLKFMQNKDAWQREIDQRKLIPEGATGTRHMIPIIDQHELTPDELTSYKQVKLTKGSATEEHQPLFLIVMPLGMTDLCDEISHGSFVGADIPRVLGIARSVAESLQYLNVTCGIMHGDNCLYGRPVTVIVALWQGT